MVSTTFLSPIRAPQRSSGRVKGAWDIFSVPPATTISASPATMARAASITVFMPEPHTMFTVKAGTLYGIPAFTPTCRATFWPRPAVSTPPKMTSSTVSGLTPARFSASFTTTAPSSTAGTSFSDPPKDPTAVRQQFTTYTSLISHVLLMTLNI